MALWVDSLWLAQRMARFDRSALRIIANWRQRGYQLCLCPSLPVLIFRLVPRLATRRLKSFLPARP
jgi:hypothetical protein